MYDTGSNEWDSIITYIDSQIGANYIVYCEGDNIILYNVTALVSGYQIKANRHMRNMGVTNISWTTTNNGTYIVPSSSIIAMNLSQALTPSRYSERGYTNVNAVSWETAKNLYYNGSTGQYQEIIDAINNTGHGIENKIDDLNDNVMEDYDDTNNDDETDQIQDFIDTFNSKLGFIAETFNFVSSLFTTIVNADASNTLTFPAVNIAISGTNYTLIQQQEVPIVPQGLSSLYDYVKLANSMILICAVFNMALNKYKEWTMK